MAAAAEEPLVTATLSKEITADEIPPTEFPDHSPQRRESGRSRVGSDSTLYDDSPETVHKFESMQPPVDEIKLPFRPNMPKYPTEMPRRVGARPSFKQRLSTGGWKQRKEEEQQQTAPVDASDTSDDSSSESDIEYPSPKKHIGQSTHKLNRTRNWGHNHVKKAEDLSNHRVQVGNDYFRSRGKVARDGRLKISVNETANTGYLAKALGATIEKHLAPQTAEEQLLAEQRKETFIKNKDKLHIPRLNIVIMVIGSRGDIQPFLKIGKILQDKYHHRVRIATHPTFKKFIEEEIGLEFFSVGGDPSELMSFMVKNPGLLPSFETVKAGEIGRRRESMYEMFQGFWRACINATDDEKDTQNLKMFGEKFPFVADAIIANPPSFAHYHCAEKLGIPLHLVFTFPYTPTTTFPHPLTNIKATNVDQNYTNYMSYPMVDLMTWQGLGDLVNRFREKTLGLEPVSTLWAPGQLSRMKVPMTYLWSPSLVPKPADWGPEIDIAGYVFLDLANSYDPPEDLEKFLDRSEDDRPLIYVGFGSIAGIDDPQAFTQMVFDGIAKANVRAVVSKGWGGMGEGLDKPDGIFLIDNVPHDWLLPKVDAVVHHGGAGTTAAGLRFGKPTMIVPFFGDQPFWSAMIAKAGAGAKEARPLKKLNVDRFAEGIKQCLEPDAKAKAEEIAKSIEREGDGAENAVDSFHRSLALDGTHNMRCGIFPDRVSVWNVKRTHMRLSALAAELLVENHQLDWSDLTLVRHNSWRDFQGPGEPITGAGGVVVTAFQEAISGISSIHGHAKHDLERRERWKRKKSNKSIANALVMPGRFAHAIHGGEPIEKTESNADSITAKLNLTGDAAPAMRPSILGGHPSQSYMGQPIKRTTTNMSNPGAPATIVLKDIGRGVTHSAKAILDLPCDFLYATTQGFRNAPRLYGDSTVRKPPPNITGFRSGVKVAGQELVFGVYDGFSGLVRVPYHDVHDGGFSALPKGIARAGGGLILKPISGVLGVVSYTDRGIRKSLRNTFHDTKKTERWIRRVRMSQGAKDVVDIQKKRATASMAAGSNVPDDMSNDKLKKPAAVRPPQPGVNNHESSPELDKARDETLTMWNTTGQQIFEGVKQRDKAFSSLRLSMSNAVPGKKHRRGTDPLATKDTALKRELNDQHSPEDQDSEDNEDFPDDQNPRDDQRASDNEKKEEEEEETKHKKARTTS